MAAPPPYGGGYELGRRVDALGKQGHDAAREVLHAPDETDGAGGINQYPVDEEVDPGAAAVEGTMGAGVSQVGGGGVVAGEAGQRGFGGEQAGGEGEADAFAGEGLDHAGGVAQQPDAPCAGAGRGAGDRIHAQPFLLLELREEAAHEQQRILRAAGIELLDYLWVVGIVW